MAYTRFDNKFPKRIDSVDSKIWEQINEIDAVKSRWSAGIRFDPQILGRFKKSVLITSTGASTRIEGAKLSDEDIERLMRGISIQKFPDRDKQEVKGYYELLSNVFENWQSIPFSESTIKFFHRELLKYAEKDEPHRGDYKHKENKVAMVSPVGGDMRILFDTTPPYLVAKEMQELVEWTQEEFLAKRFHPILIVANFIVEFLKVHPFEDGNGRLSRVLTNLLLLQQGYLYMPYISHEKIVEDNKPEYYVALRRSQKTFGTKNESIAAWLEFFSTILVDQAKRAIKLLSKEEIDKLLSRQQQTVWKHLEKANEATPLEIAKATGVPRPTVSQAITKLMKLKRIERIGGGRATRYRKI
jgi:Fic family protein